ncbi:F-box protein At2g16365-like isoform X2 [Mangifera indica]|uniref:F-box protein At2g16365-like isoform X2 n=1 Tax=Mangifera indica TaxID=29780 RepID=UPI001CFB93A7|nr:F-box protein At2g16365-like isoform X2 [Mangifera indica]
MSDHVIQSNHDGEGMRRESMHLYQSIWMAHWTHTSHKSETRYDKPLSSYCEYKEEDCDSKQHGPEIPSGISEHTKKFGEVFESRTANIIHENLKLSSIKSGKEILESHFFPKFSLSKKESTMPLNNVTTKEGTLTEMGTSSGEFHFQHEGVLGDQEQQVKSHESIAKKSLAVSTSFPHDVGSSSKIVPCGYNSRKSPIYSFICGQEKINQSGTTEGHPKYSQTTHHFLITKKTDVNLSEGGEMFKEKLFSKYLSPSSDFGFLGQLDVKIQPLGSTTDSEEKGKMGDIKTSAVSLKNESSADTDTMDMDVYQKDHFSEVVSSPKNEVMKEDKVATSQAAVALTREEIGGRLPNIELADINQELPGLPSVANSVDDSKTTSSRTQSLDLEHLLSHAELPTNSKSVTFPDGHIGSDPSIRWIKRLKLSASGSFAHGTKISEMEEASSNEKVNKFVNKIMRRNITRFEPKMGKCSAKEPTVLDRTAGLLSNGESYFSEALRNTQDISLSNCWIRRWCHDRAASRTQNCERVTLCKPGSSKATLDELQKKQFPSIRAMAMMGKALNSFQPCEFRKKRSYIVWKT